jgi:CRP-like cAMP-binding protein
MLDDFIRKLRLQGPMRDDDEALLRHLPHRLVSLSRADEVAHDGDIVTQSCIVTDGFLQRQKVAQDGGRQILSFQPPGDAPDLFSLQLGKMDHALVATSPAQVAMVQHSDLRAACRQSPTLNDLLWRDTLIDAARGRYWLLMLGRAEALTRMAHLFAEMYLRMRMIGRVNQGSFDFPVTQGDLADALGHSTVHANRILQGLRRRELLAFDGHRVTVPGWERLKAFAQFDASYLHYTDERAGA